MVSFELNVVVSLDARAVTKIVGVVELEEATLDDETVVLPAVVAAVVAPATVVVAAVVVVAADVDSSFLSSSDNA